MLSHSELQTRQKEIHDQINIVRGFCQRPMSFAQAWNGLKGIRPDLFDDLDDPDPSPAGPPTSTATQEMSERLRKRDALSLAAAPPVERAEPRFTPHGHRTRLGNSK
jgi:hypothetical protein